MGISSKKARAGLMKKVTLNMPYDRTAGSLSLRELRAYIQLVDKDFVSRSFEVITCGNECIVDDIRFPKEWCKEVDPFDEAYAELTCFGNVHIPKKGSTRKEILREGWNLCMTVKGGV